MFHGDKVDPSSTKALFKKLACNKAKNVLQEILDGNASDLPNVHLHLHQLDKKVNLKRYKDKFYLHCSIRGTY